MSSNNQNSNNSELCGKRERSFSSNDYNEKELENDNISDLHNNNN